MLKTGFLLFLGVGRLIGFAYRPSLFFGIRQDKRVEI
jgi:hypothetical protein